MAYLLDSDVVIRYFAGDAPTRALVDPLFAHGASISMISYMEVLQGIIESADPRDGQDAFDDFLSGVPILPFSEDVARRCAALRRDLKQQGKRVRPRVLDLITAATALHSGLTLVTRNTADYDDIPGLTLH
jgi:predicted nucleic acid-binding protein